jgi:Family of unknown function (DUF6326)
MQKPFDRREKMRSANVLENSTVHVKAKISALWVSVMFCYAYGDLTAFYVPGALQRIMTGKMGPWPATPKLLLGVAVFMSIPALMIALALLLRPAASRWLNVVMGSAYTALILFTMIDAWKLGSYFYIYLGVVEVVLTSLVVWYALSWPRQNGGGSAAEMPERRSAAAPSPPQF